MIDMIEAASLEENSGLEINDRRPIVAIYQDLIEAPITGCWSEQNEQAWKKYASRHNWDVVLKVIRRPKFWYVAGQDLEPPILDLEF